MGYKRKSPQPIIEGGTNTQSFTHVFGTAFFDGTGLNNVAPGTSGYVLTSQGLNPPAFAPAGSASFAWNDVTTPTASMDAYNGYVAHDGATLVTLTLPLTAAFGSTIQVQGLDTGLWTIAQNADQTIVFNQVSSTTGVTGSVSSTSQYDSITLLCVVADTTWTANSFTGNLSVI